VRKDKFKEVEIQSAKPYNSFSLETHWTVLQATQKLLCYFFLDSTGLISKIINLDGEKIQESQNYTLVPG